MLSLQFEVYNTTDQILLTYNAGNSFSLNEWTYCGVSMYKTSRKENDFEIHLVTKTKSGVENQISFNSETIEFECYFINVSIFTCNNT